MIISRPFAAAVPLICTILTACQPAKDPPPERQPPFIDIGDGSKVTALGALRSAGELATEHKVTIYFIHEELGQGSISVFSQKQQQEWGDFDSFTVTLTKDHIIIGDDLMTRDERLEKLREFSLGARVSESTPMLAVCANRDVSGLRLIEVFHELLASDLKTILAPYSFEPN